MLKPILYFLLFVSTIHLSWAQPDANGWINYNQTYLCFKVAEEGIYRIDRNTLTAIENDFITVNPQNIQVFAKGKEQPIYVHGEGDLSFDSGDYIELYCQPNDGFLDSLMYDNPEEMNNPYYSQVNDTLLYYITWEDSPTPKKRFTTYSSDNYQNYDALNSVLQEDYYLYDSKFYWGKRIAPYSTGKGWFDASSFDYDTPRSINYDISDKLSSSNIDVSFSVTGVPNSDVYSNLNHHLKVTYASDVKSEASYTGYNGVKDNFTISGHTDDILTLVFSSNYNVGGQPDLNTLAYVFFEYQRGLDYNNEGELRFKLPAQDATKRLGLSNFSTQEVHLYNTTRRERTLGVNNSGVWEFVLNPSSQKQDFYAAASDSIHQITDIELLSLTDYTNLSEEPDYLMVYHSSLGPSTADFEAYRSAQGYKVLKADIEQLYHQFGYGVYKHPMSIRNFVDFISTEYSKPDYLFLIGKSITTALMRKDSSGYANCLVPTMGNPSSDLLLSSGLDNGSLKPALMTGRLAARTDDDVELYLEKVQAYESQENAIWQKKGIHFGGGGNTYEQNTFKNYLKEYELLYGDTLVGGFVNTFLKNSSDPIQISVSDSVEILINQGVSILNFFGHGSSSGFDQNIDEPEVYNNNGKYPLIIANSCLSGDIHQNTDYKTISEKWLLIDNKGAIAFLASADLGFASQLHALSREFYRSLSYRSYGGTLGEIVQNAIEYYSQNQENNQFIRKTVLDNTLHGDPALKFYHSNKPDLSIENSGLDFIDEPITSEIDSFEVHVDYYNLGQAFVDSFLISVERIYPDGETEFLVFQKPSAFYSDQLSVKFPTNILDALGQNRIRVQLDYLGQVDELREDNNEINIDFLIYSDDLVPVYPYEFAVVSEVSQTLKASSGNPFAEDFTAVFQVDTTDTFDSPFLQSNTIVTDGGLTEWDLPFSLADSTVYFWRVAKEGSDQWRESSFRYIEGKEGWSQAHHFQFKNDDYLFIDYQKEERRFKYIETPKTLLCKNIGSVPETRLAEVGYWMDGVGDQNSCGTSSSFSVVVIDSLTLDVWESDYQYYGQKDFPKCFSRNNPDKYFQFTSSDTTAMEGMAAMFADIPEGKHVLVYSIWNGHFTQLPEITKQAFEQLYPSTQIRNIADNLPYILYVQKGKPDSAQEVIGTHIYDEISLTVDLNTNFNFGNVYSKLIGPATQWHSFHWNYKNNIDQKLTELKILGIDTQGQEQILIEDLDKDSLNLLNLADRIDASTYPYLKLEMFTKDSISKEPTQLKSWTLLFDEVPETAIEPDHAYYFHKDTVEQGEEVVFAISTHNISSKDMDSLMVSYYVRNNENEVALIKSTKLRPHPSADFITDTVVFNTIHNRGAHSIWVEFNPMDSTGVYDQLEQYHFNNIALKYFFVKTDNTNPLLNVTFDGIHIMDGDIVSPNPEILIKINDENKYLVMDDPDLVSVYLKRTGDQDEIKVEQFDSLSNQQLFWHPSSLPDNVAEMLFTPKNLPDGTYTLRVGATDASSNESGIYDYQINFEVINKSTISEVLNYPNPFSTSTQFVFTLTGTEIPEEVVVQIMTVTGKVVKEINLSEQANLRIGRNITDYKWDGRDTYGDLLANGVYFYRMIVKNAGKPVELNATQASKYFKEGIGKMYIIR